MVKFWLFLIGVCIPFMVSEQRPALEKDIEDGYLNEYSKVEAAFILSGITRPDSLQVYVQWYQQELQKIKSFNLDYDNPMASARIVFLYLHTSWLKKYALESTTLIDIVKRKEYNCVAATILFNLLCEDLGWQCSAFETRTHVYTIFSDFNHKILVENTSSMGYDIMKNLKAYSKYLLKNYPRNYVLRIGLDRLYLHNNSEGREIDNTELLGLLAYNRAYLARDKKDYEASYKYVLLAQLFNTDSRSNIDFEIGLYYEWGKRLFDRQKFGQAFTVFADGYYRYPDNENLAANTLAAFYNGMGICWLQKDWPESKRLIEEMLDIKLLKEDGLMRVKMMCADWVRYLSYIKDKKAQAEAEKILEKLK